MKTIFLKYLAIVACSVLLFPVGLSVNHILESHEHKVCDNPDNLHFHEETVDCSLYTFNLNPITTFLEPAFKTADLNVLQEHNFVTYNLYLDDSESSIFLRGPPQFS